MPAPYTGNCLCGAVRFTIASEPKAVLSCFCEHCSKGAGGTNQVIAKFETEHVNIMAADNAITTYTLLDTSTGNAKEKAFCKTCGCPLWTIPGSAKGVFHLIRTALLDQGLELQPGSEIFVKNRPSWMAASEGTTQWEGMRK